jgi:predicted alpha/beta hydrolase
MVSVLRAAREVAIAATDGYRLGATVFETRRARTTVVIHGATAVPQSYYAAFAEWLAMTGVRVVTYDYRGVGASRRGSLKGFAATMTDWVERDARAVHAWAGDDVAMIGHSFGGQLIGLLDDLRDVRAAVLVATQLGYYGHWPIAQRARLWATWHVVLPMVVAAAGYLPGRLGLGEDLPAGVALEWARWCRDAEYLIGARPDAAARFAAWSRPTMMIAVKDDPLAPARAIAALAARLSNAPLERRRIDEPLGHFGFFRPRASAHWDEVAEFLCAPAITPFVTTDEIEEDLRYGR